MKKKTLGLVLTLLLVVSAALAGCSTGGGDSKDSGSSTDGKKVLRLTDTSDITTVDPAQATDAVAFGMIANTMEGLYRLDVEGKAVPALAEKTDISKDNLTYTFTIRDAKWSDGTPVKAQDFEFAWKRAIDPDTASGYAYIFESIKNGADVSQGKKPVDELGVKATDDKTLVVTLERPAPYFLSLTSFGTFTPISEDFYKKNEKDFSLQPDKLLYNGPFVWSEWKTDQKRVLTKNENYWDKDAVKLDSVDIRVVKDTSTTVNLYDANEIDFTGLTSEQVAAYKDSEDFKTALRSSIAYLKFNNEDDVMKNADARKAIARAINPAGITDTLLSNGSIPTTSFIPKEFAKDESGKDYTEGINWFDRDAKEAADLWKKANGDKAVTIELLSFDSEDAKKIGEYMKGEIEKNLPNVTVSIKQQPFKNKLDLEAKGDYQISYALWGPDYQDPMTNLSIFSSENSQNDVNYKSSEFDKLLFAANEESDTEKRFELFKKAEEQLIAKDQAIAPIYQAGSAYLARPTIVDFKRQVFGADYQYKYVDVKK
ncbi:peptide ABC transporter substrate-binding protein [Exiguobacterium flavidum]|uniref:peptide ABC transporter substrate-binding protein n=1 Tax=Exiguobacterium flavidum TaxID=2184695 RepID=UPI000DF729FB|nr:peptide ABC transporter substrate-binding protein [Exiguobacterium flavidum]